MGTGGFGGGSGSLGGGGAGSAGSGGSLLRAITYLRDIARMLTADGDQARLTREINALLRERGRAGFMAGLFQDPFATTLLDRLIELSRAMQGQRWSGILDQSGVAKGSGSITAYCDVAIDQALREHGDAVDERHIDRVGLAFRSFLATALAGDNLAVAERGDAAAVEVAFDRTRFADPNDIRRGFLGQIIAKSIVGESCIDLGASELSVERAANTIAAAIQQRFEEKFVRTRKAASGDLLATIGANYSKLVIG
ncbi:MULTISPECIES: hypothetical protein [Mesorhizobium]|uniref:hypothetical protein n=1 Tax=Mesorhizobium TaxID=68287 RepID=UPI0007ECE540|nr:MULTISPECIES: hypothetical protein [Mesorhizobium]TPJ40413.1 hypothetical protein FJ437_26260 [Mesorhizobium sp. B2-6-6]ARP67204.1 hypothetical protein A9K65_030570 [Mesorhizobium sp. WSM1497]MCA0002789.1 hypothetical protein [Mesorhizobium sp. B264B2A]MCA0009060.1 hypothetical protein [Mesorhizobium sp. B264B1B]MCA0014543.1 hypothetical protein [Mesorhizobium sp. B294B1A1]